MLGNSENIAMLSSLLQGWMESNSIDWTMKGNYEGMSDAIYSKTAPWIQNIFMTP